MIKIVAFRNKEHIGFEIKGHADYDDHGYDIVCAAVSILSHTIYRSLVVNLDLEDELDVEIKDGFMTLLLARRGKDVDLLFDTFIEGIRSLEEGYGDFIKLTLEEE